MRRNGTQQQGSFMKQNKETPTVEQLEKELGREKYQGKFKSAMSTTVCILLSISAVTVLVATMVLPVLRIYGDSMSPTIENGSIVVSVKGNDIQQGDVIAFYYDNKILVKRVIAESGQWVDIEEDGTVSVDGITLDESYVQDLSYETCDITLPYQVPDEQYFVIGDYRSTSVDSRSTKVGCVTKDQIVGKLLFTVWPFEIMGFVK